MMGRAGRAGWHVFMARWMDGWEDVVSGRSVGGWVSNNGNTRIG